MKLMRFENKTIVVTGASSGIGYACAERLAKEGARLILVARDENRLNTATEYLSAHTAVSGFSCDVSDEVALKAFASKIKDIGAVNGIVHCAGIHWLRPLQLMNTVKLNEMLTSHVVSSVMLVQTLLGSRVLQNEGSIVWMSSVAGLKGEAGTVAYAAAKGAMISAARALAVELASKKIRVNTISPGFVKTQQGENLLAKLSPEQKETLEKSHLLGIGKPEQIASVAAFLLSEDASWITGTNLVVDGGLTIH